MAWLLLESRELLQDDLKRSRHLLYLAAVIDNLAAEIPELAVNAARDIMKRVILRHLKLAIRNSEELI
jgi:hypothetical protein